MQPWEKVSSIPDANTEFEGQTDKTQGQIKTEKDRTDSQRKISPLLRNGYNLNAYFSGNKYIDKPLLKKLPGQTETELLEFPQQPTLRRRQREPLDKVFSRQSGRST
jgi:hypothetical protein